MLQIAELHQIHYKFIHAVEPLMEHWTEEQSIAEPFKLLVNVMLFLDILQLVHAESHLFNFTCCTLDK